MDAEQTTASKIKDAEMAEPDYSSVYCEAAKQIVGQHLANLAFREAFQTIKGAETILETIEKCGVSTLDGALQSVRIAGSIAAYLCRDGLHRANNQNHIV